jgi:hypothetical protein
MTYLEQPILSKVFLGKDLNDLILEIIWFLENALHPSYMFNSEHD